MLLPVVTPLKATRAEVGVLKILGLGILLFRYYQNYYCMARAGSK